MSCKFPADMLQALFNITTDNMDYSESDANYYILTSLQGNNLIY